MSYDTIEEWIRTELGNLETEADMVLTADWLFENDYWEPRDRDIRTEALKDRIQGQVDHGIRQILSNLTEEGITTVTSSSGNRYIHNHRLNKMFWTPGNPEFLPLLKEEVSRFLIDVDQQEGAPPSSPGETTADGGYRTPRAVGEAALGIPQGELEVELTGTLEPYAASQVDGRDDIAFDDPVARMSSFDTAVQAVIESPETSRGREYDQMGWRNPANRYSLSERAVKIERNRSIDDYL